MYQSGSIYFVPSISCSVAQYHTLYTRTPDGTQNIAMMEVVDHIAGPYSPLLDLLPYYLPAYPSTLIRRPRSGYGLPLGIIYPGRRAK